MEDSRNGLESEDHYQPIEERNLKNIQRKADMDISVTTEKLKDDTTKGKNLIFEDFFDFLIFYF
jgi:hypothetical protein